ncbi:MAG: NAD(P)H-hydrate dehydratase, partial [Clostridiales bacterium]|nr:NAD(P)H-hydrate dehydratase [Clostridiales bacterium]
EEIMKRYSSKVKILVVGGMGNNGGDVFCAGRILAEYYYQVVFYLVGEYSKCTEETKKQITICKNCGLSFIQEVNFLNYDMIIEGIFGIGLNREPVGIQKEMIHNINRSGLPVISADIPSGVNADTGAIYGEAINASLTVTFAYKKRGHLLYPGKAYSKELVCRKIGISDLFLKKDIPGAFGYDKDDLQRIPKRNPAGNKGSFGKVLVIAGNQTIYGASYLCALSALRTGAGMVMIYTSSENRSTLQKAIPEALIETYDANDYRGETLEKAVEWADCIAIGPGIGTDQIAIEIISQVLELSENKAMVMDADALNMIAARPELMKTIDVLTGSGKPVVFTPHLKEFSRLCQKEICKIQQEGIGLLEQYCQEHQIVLTCKDATTIVCAKQKPAYINQSGNEGMATAGTGDVLTGIIIGLIAQGMSAYEAACMGVFLHGYTGDLCKMNTNGYSLMASDLVEQLKYSMKEAEKSESL